MILSWLAGTDRNIHSWLCSIISKHSRAYSGTADTECFIGKCHSLTNYIATAKPFLFTRPFIRIEILNLQGQERQVFSSNLTISNCNFEFIPRAFFVVDAGKYEDARHIEKKRPLKMPQWLTRRNGINCFFPVVYNKSTGHLYSESTLWCSETMTTMQQNDRNDSQNLPSETSRSTMRPILTRGWPLIT